MFLIRTAFWLGVVVMLLPTDAKRQSQLYSSAADVAGRAWTYCDRNTQMCDQGREVWKTFSAKAQFGAKLVFDIATERMAATPVSQQEAGEPAQARQLGAPPRTAAHRPSAVSPRQDTTLTDEDLAPAWQPLPSRPRI